MGDITDRDFYYLLPLHKETREDKLFMDMVIFRKYKTKEPIKQDKKTQKSLRMKSSSPNQSKNTDEAKGLPSGSDSTKMLTPIKHSTPYTRRPKSPSPPERLAPGLSNSEKQKDIVDDFCDTFVPLLQKYPQLCDSKPLETLFNQMVATRNVASTSNNDSPNNANDLPQELPDFPDPNILSIPVSFPSMVPYPFPNVGTFNIVPQQYLSLSLPGMPTDSVGSVLKACLLQAPPTSQ